MIKHHHWHRLIAALGMSIPVMLVSSARAGSTPLATELVASGLVYPVLATHAPGDTTRLFIVEKPGLIRILNLKTGVLQTAGSAFLDINSIVGGGTTTNSEQGLLGLAFHPDYQTNGFFFVYYTNNLGDSVIARYSVLSADAADADSGEILMTIDQPQANHNAGWIGFDPTDGTLYIATGDGGGSCDTGTGHTTGSGNGQDITNNLLGKMLRIDIDADQFPADPNRNYTIPVDNPFVGITGDDEIWSYGLRNPWRCSFDRVTGDLYIGDVGQSSQEEVDYQPGSSIGGENYGWRCMEGDGCSSDSSCVTTGCTCFDGALSDPIRAYTHNPPPAPAGFVCSVVGGYVYRGCSIPDLTGTYFFADYCGGAVWSFVVIGGVATDYTDRSGELSPSIEVTLVNQVTSFGEDARGEMYIVDHGMGTDGRIFRIRAETYSVPFTDIVCSPTPTIDVQDLIDLLANWGPCVGCAADVNGDDTVDVLDLIDLLADWGPVVPLGGS